MLKNIARKFRVWTCCLQTAKAILHAEILQGVYSSNQHVILWLTQQLRHSFQPMIFTVYREEVLAKAQRGHDTSNSPHINSFRQLEAQSHLWSPLSRSLHFWAQPPTGWLEGPDQSQSASLSRADPCVWQVLCHQISSVCKGCRYR